MPSHVNRCEIHTASFDIHSGDRCQPTHCLGFVHLIWAPGIRYVSTGQDRFGGWTAGFAYHRMQIPLCSFSLVLNKAIRSRRNMGSEGRPRSALRRALCSCYTYECNLPSGTLWLLKVKHYKCYRYYIRRNCIRELNAQLSSFCYSIWSRRQLRHHGPAFQGSRDPHRNADVLVRTNLNTWERKLSSYWDNENVMAVA